MAGNEPLTPGTWHVYKSSLGFFSPVEFAISSIFYLPRDSIRDRMEPRDRESPIVNFVQLFLRMSVMLNMLYRKREREREREKPDIQGECCL